MLKSESTAGKTGWFVHDRFGLFIHWGIYSVAARHEWVKNYERITDEEYQKYFDHFNPDLYDPSVWAKAAKNAGMKYVVITTKHHDGFCLSKRPENPVAFKPGDEWPPGTKPALAGVVEENMA